MSADNIHKIGSNLYFLENGQKKENIRKRRRFRPGSSYYLHSFVVMKWVNEGPLLSAVPNTQLKVKEW